MDTIYENKGFSCCVLSTSDVEFAQYQELRDGHWFKEGWEERSYPGQHETDDYDAEATFVGVVYESRLTGGFRLISADDVTSLPFAEYCCESLSGPGVEISRWCTDHSLSRSLRKGTHSTMLQGLLIHLMGVGVDVAYMDVVSRLFKHLNEVKFVVDACGEYHARDDGTQFIPASLNVPASAENIGLIHQKVRVAA